MAERLVLSRFGVVLGLSALSCVLLSNAACSSDDTGGTDARAGSSNQATGGGTTTGGSSPVDAAGADNGTGLSSGGTTSATGGSNSVAGAAALGGTTGSAGETSSAGSGASGGVVGTGGTSALCLFHTDAPTQLDGEAGSGGVGGSAGGAAGSAGAPAVTYDVGVKLNQALGEHLITKLGLTLYTYASDLPGDCSNAPVTNCTKDCLKAWPVFDAGLRSLDPKLSDAGFGRFLRPDGVYQTTYYGWPLYTYVDKAGLPDVGISGQSKSWNVAETATPTVVIMKQAVKDGIRYLADYRGRTLYTFDKDTVGTADAYPVSACSGSCSAKYPALMDRSFSTVPSLEPTDFGMFVREGGGLQISYKGAPLYYSVADQKPGTMDGAADGFAVVKIQ